MPIPGSYLKDNTVARLQVPFLGEHYELGFEYYVPEGATQIELLTSEPASRGAPAGAASMTTWGIVGWGLAGPPDKREKDDLLACTGKEAFVPVKGLQVYVGGSIYPDSANPCRLRATSPELLTLRVPTSELKGVEKVVLVFPGHPEPIALKAPTKKVAAPQAKVDGPASAAQKTSVAVSFKGVGLDQVDKVIFEGKELSFQAKSKELIVFLSRDVTKEKGPVDLRATTKTGKTLQLRLNIT